MSSDRAQILAIVWILCRVLKVTTQKEFEKIAQKFQGKIDRNEINY